MGTTELQRWLDDLASADPQIRTKGADELAALGPAAHESLDVLRSKATSDPVPEVRAAALRAAVRIEPTGAVELALAALLDPHPAVRRMSVREIKRVGPAAHATIPNLWSAFDGEGDLETVAPDIAETLVAVEADYPSEFERALGMLANDDTIANSKALLLLGALPLDAHWVDRAYDALTASVERSSNPFYLSAALRMLLRYGPDADTVIDWIFDRQTELQAGVRSHLAGAIVADLETLTGAGAALDRWWTNDRAYTLSVLVAALASTDPKVIPPVLNLLSAIAHSLDEAERAAVTQSVWKCIETNGTGFSTIFALATPAQAIIDYLSRLDVDKRPLVGRALVLDDSQWLNDQWATSHRELLPFVLVTFANPDWRTRYDSVVWIGNHCRGLSPSEYREIEKALRDRLRDDDDQDVRKAADQTLLKLTEQRAEQQRHSETSEFVNAIRQAPSDELRSQAVDGLLGMNTPDALRALVAEWSRLVASGGNPLLTNYGAQKLRELPDAVLPLVSQFDQELELDDDLQQLFIAQISPPDCRGALAKSLRSEHLDVGEVVRISEWARSLPEGDRPDLTTFPTTDALRQFLRTKLESARRNGTYLSRLRIARLLAEMSDPRFKPDDMEDATFQRTLKQLQKHAVQSLGRYLATEERADVRESIARVLGNVGTPEAVDVLARALVGQERTRDSRQRLLADYYLDPSKERSDEASKILIDAVSEARRTLRILQYLNVIFFGVGLAALVVGLAVLVLSKDAGARLAGVGVTGAGFIGLLIQMVREPLDRIQNGLARLVQVETAFTGFIWELNLNGTYIQSQYVAEGILTDDEIASTNERVQLARRAAMDLIAQYSVTGTVRPPLRITSLLPAAGAPGDLVVVTGTGLGSSGSSGRRTRRMVALNHAPSVVGDVTWSDAQVSFRLPAATEIVSPSSTLWVSLVVDGLETNALALLLHEPEPEIVLPLESASRADGAGQQDGSGTRRGERSATGS